MIVTIRAHQMTRSGIPRASGCMGFIHHSEREKESFFNQPSSPGGDDCGQGLLPEKGTKPWIYNEHLMDESISTSTPVTEEVN